MELYKQKNPNLGVNEYTEWADQFEQKVIQPVIAQCIDDFSKDLNAFNKNVIGAEREIIADSAVFVSKKKYFARVRDSEGVRYPEDNPYMKKMGLEVIRSSTPEWAKKYLTEAMPHILDKDENDLREWVNNIKTGFTGADLISISQVGAASNLNYTIGVDKGIPIGARAALVHNRYIKEKEIDNKFSPIQPGDKCKRLFLQEPNPFHSNIVAFTDENFTSELSGYVDYDTNFEKSFLRPLQLMVESLGYNLDKETESLDDW
jgi:hypothetical protein